MSRSRSLTPSLSQRPLNRSGAVPVAARKLRQQVTEAYEAWIAKSPSADTNSNYDRDLRQFLAYLGFAAAELEGLLSVRPPEVAAWRDHLLGEKYANSSVCRKMTVLRSFYSYLQSYGFSVANPAHSDFVAAPAVPGHGKTVALSPENCRLLLDAPEITVKKEKTKEVIPRPIAIRDRALLGILAYTGCRVGELTRLKVGSYKLNGVHKVLEIYGKGGKERLVPLHKEAEERLEAWLDLAGIRDNVAGPLFRPVKAAQDDGRSGFAAKPLTRRAVQKLVEGYVRRLGFDNITVHSLRVTALTTARERGSDIIDLQEFAGHSDPRTTLTYIRSRDRLGKSPAYKLNY